MAEDNVVERVSPDANECDPLVGLMASLDELDHFWQKASCSRYDFYGDPEAVIRLTTVVAKVLTYHDRLKIQTRVKNGGF